MRGVILCYDSEAIDKIVNGKAVEISTGYTCKLRRETGTWQGERYDAIQEVIDVNHVCTTADTADELYKREVKANKIVSALMYLWHSKLQC